MHYRNGREAKVGDQVIGTAYNTNLNGRELFEANRAGGPPPVPVPKILAGVLVKVVPGFPGTEKCNAEVEWIESTDIPTVEPLSVVRPWAALGEPIHAVAGDGKARLSWRCRDYTDCGALLHVEDAWTIT